MAGKSKSKGTKVKSVVAKAIKKVTAVRNTSIPPKTSGSSSTMSTANRAITQEAIARRAYEIYASGKGGSQLDNWLRAEKELRGGR